MRGVAALLVLAGHVLFFGHPHGGFFATLGLWTAPFGVVVFFVISGFLIYRPFIAARGTSRNVGSIVPSYLLRRATRILPAYWLALTVLAIWPGLTGVFSGHWWVDYGLLQIYTPSWQVTGMGTAWTLCVEVTFYLSLPFVALFLQDRGIGCGRDPARELRWEFGVLAVLAASSLLWRSAVGSHPGTAYLIPTLPGTFSWFCMGMFLAALQIAPSITLQRVRSTLSRPELCWPVAVLVFAVLVAQPIRDSSLPAGLKIALESNGLVVAALLLMGPAVLADAKRLVHRLLANEVAIFLGTVSYGIYLWHFPVVNWLATSPVVISSPAPELTLTIVAFPLAMRCGTASWYLIERPLMRRVRSVKGFTDIKEGRVDIPPEVDASRAQPADDRVVAGEAAPAPTTAT
jgi:peptidoglycan/LPS O-acetylase OafA/YrhL